MKTILVVDDNPDFLSALVVELHRVGYRTVTANDGDEALALLASALQFDAAIVDLAMPRVGGFQVIAELGRLRAKAIPLLAITSAYPEQHLEVAEYLGAKASMRKPPEGASLLPIVEALATVLH